ncbi:MAG: hypothetical protein AAGH67_01005 [Cyanobacteria bacterium P01_H01_bin.162]
MALRIPEGVKLLIVAWVTGKPRKLMAGQGSQRQMTALTLIFKVAISENRDAKGGGKQLI